MGGGVGGVGGSGPVYFNPAGDPDPKQQAYKISGDLVSEAKSRVDLQEKINSLEDRIKGLDVQIEAAEKAGDTGKVLQLRVTRDECMNKISMIKLKDLPLIDDKIDKLLINLSNVYSQLKPEDKATVDSIKNAFANRDQINEQTIVDLTDFHDKLNPNP